MPTLSGGDAAGAAHVLGDVMSPEDQRGLSDVSIGGIGAAADEHLLNLLQLDLAQGLHVIRQVRAGAKRLQCGQVELHLAVIIAARVGKQLNVVRYRKVLYWKWNPPGNTHSSTTWIGTSAAIAAITLSSADQLFQKTIIKPVIRAVIQHPNLIHARSHHQFISFIITS